MKLCRLSAVEWGYSDESWPFLFALHLFLSESSKLMGETSSSLYAGSADENRYQLGSEPAAVLLSDLRDAAEDGWTLATDPATRLVDATRLVYDTEPSLGAHRLVAVLSASTRWSGWLAQRIHAALRDDRKMIRKGDVVTLREVGKRARCSEKTVYEWKKLPAAPRPFRRHPELYDWQDWSRFLKERERYRNKKSGVMPPGR